MKIYFTLILIILIRLAKGQTDVHAQNFISIGYTSQGFLSQRVNTDFLNNEIDVTGLNPIVLDVLYGINEHWNIGLMSSFQQMNISFQTNDPSATFDNFIGSGKTKVYSISLLASLNYHYPIMDKLDPYISGGLGYQKAVGQEVYIKSHGTIPINENNPYAAEITAGLRYFPVSSVGIYLQGGISVSFLQAGVVYRF